MSEINDELLPEIIEKRELNFSFQEKYCKRVEELLGHDERLLRIYYLTDMANKSQNELCNQLAYLTCRSVYQLKGQELVDKAICKISFFNKSSARMPYRMPIQSRSQKRISLKILHSVLPMKTI
ncbi:hypothetical protein [Nostoc sp.]|uniref:hypothetical protein n=1 Tax=Nostoc sp. TaxID=1180 RepID=UPI002FEF1C8F